MFHSLIYRDSCCSNSRKYFDIIRSQVLEKTVCIFERSENGSIRSYFDKKKYKKI